MTDYPAWICADCGENHGRRPANPYATWHPDTCCICKRETMVTEPRDYGHLQEGWAEVSRAALAQGQKEGAER